MALVVFTGGARSGKSTAALQLARTHSPDGRVTVVVFGREDVDPEFAGRIEGHRAQRPSSWETLEAGDSAGWLGHVPGDAFVVLDCLGTLLGLAMEEAFEALHAGALGDADAQILPEGLTDALDARFDPVVEWIATREGDTVVVTNEVGDGVVPGYASGRLFRDVLGRANRRLVDRADAAYLCVAGRLVDLSDLPRHGRWPTD